MKVYQIRIKLFLLKDIDSQDASMRISKFIDAVLAKDNELLKFHNEKKYKFYCHDLFYPIEKDKIYKKENIYTITVRTVNSSLAFYFEKELSNHYDNYMKALTCEVRVLPKKHIEKIFSVTSCIMKNDCGYWRGNLSVEEFETRLVSNIIKKYNCFNNSKISEDFELYNRLEFLNKKPIVLKLKEISLIGDKVMLFIEDNDMAQELAYFSLGTGLLENTARGCGFMNYRYL